MKFESREDLDIFLQDVKVELENELVMLGLLRDIKFIFDKSNEKSVEIEVAIDNYFFLKVEILINKNLRLLFKLYHELYFPILETSNYDEILKKIKEIINLKIKRSVWYVATN